MSRSVRREARQKRFLGQLEERVVALLTGKPSPVAVGSGPVETDLVFADDSRQRAPSRPGMGALVGIGGISVPADLARGLQQDIDSLCVKTGFPPGAPFKWSPDKRQWMHDQLTGEDRTAFFVELMSVLKAREAIALVVIADETHRPATGAASPDLDVTTMFLERASVQFARQGVHGLIVVDRPGGDRPEELAFLASCLDTIQSGMTYVLPDRIAHNVLTTLAHLSRLLQAADVVAGCTVAHVAGELRFSPPVFSAIKELLDHQEGRIGGVGLKLHPDLRYANLYHWLLADTVFWKANVGVPLPLHDRPYAAGPFVP